MRATTIFLPQADEPGSRHVQARWRTATMKPHIFQSQKTPELFGFTVDVTGENLPSEAGPWQRAGATIPLGAIMAATSPKIGQQIQLNGYALLKGYSTSAAHLYSVDVKP